MAAPTILKNMDWVILHGPGFTVECVRCGRQDTIKTPIPVSSFKYFVRGFQEVHRLCKVKA